MKWLAIVLVVGVALYAVYELFAGKLMQAGTPGQTTAAGTAVAGYPTYSNVATPSNNNGLSIGGISSLAAAVAPSAVSDAFGSISDSLGSDDIDISDLGSSLSGSYDNGGLDFD